jgi:hypothetical protein
MNTEDKLNIKLIKINELYKITEKTGSLEAHIKETINQHKREILIQNLERNI